MLTHPMKSGVRTAMAILMVTPDCAAAACRKYVRTTPHPNAI